MPSLCAWTNLMSSLRVARERVSGRRRGRRRRGDGGGGALGVVLVQVRDLLVQRIARPAPRGVDVDDAQRAARRVEDGVLVVGVVAHLDDEAGRHREERRAEVAEDSRKS